VLIFFLSALLPEFAIRYKIGSMTSHSIPLFSPLHANISKAILLWTIKHHFMSEKPHDHAAVVCRILPKFTSHCWASAAEMISQHSSFRSRCYKVRRSHTQNDSIIARHQLCSSGPLLAATAHAFITYSIWPAKLFLYIYGVYSHLLVGRSAR
jgi:hypothetical protein